MAWLKSYFCKLLCLFLMCISFSNGTYAQGSRPKYRVQKIFINNEIIKVEIAESEAEHQFGLMFKKKLNINSGMLFIFSDFKVRNFWMKNTLIPLSIGFFDANYSLISTHEMNPYIEGSGSPQIYSSGLPAKFALEMNKNWFTEKKIKIGDKFKFIK